MQSIRHVDWQIITLEKLLLGSAGYSIASY